MQNFDTRRGLNQAQELIARRQYSAALSPLWQVVGRRHTDDRSFAAALSMMAQAFEGANMLRAAATIHLYQGDWKSSWRLIGGADRGDQEQPQAGDPFVLDRARIFAASGRHGEAGQAFEAYGWLGHAALQYEIGEDHRMARALWERLSRDDRLREAPYVHGLVLFNLGRVCARQGDRKAARQATVASIHLLEAAADGLEAAGLRERAFDCFQVLLTVGKGGAFENLAEGYLNCIRILREDHLKYYVLQYYEDFQALALECGELHAAATLFLEAAAFARNSGLPYEAHYRWRAAETQAMAAEQTLAARSSAELAENAFAAAIDSFNALGSYSQVQRMYEAMSLLPLSDKRRARYRRLGERLSGVPDEPFDDVGFPEYLRMATAYPDIWRLDVIEWEQDGDAAETMAEIIVDEKWPEFTRRRALMCRLWQLGSTEPGSVASLARQAEDLGRVEIYPALAPLERLSRHGSAKVRAAVQRAVRQMFFKRSFGIVVSGLRDSEESVRKEAVAAVSALHFAHAFDPLARIYRESTEPPVRMAALESIGRINSVDAVEFLVDVLRHGVPEERNRAGKLLARAEHPDLRELVRRAAEMESGDRRRQMLAVVS